MGARYDQLGSPANDLVSITPADGADQGSFRGLVFGGAGAIKIKTRKGNAVTLPSGVLNAGIIHGIRFNRVYATGTTATNIWAVPDEG